MQKGSSENMLGGFIQAEMENRRMNPNEFAALVGVGRPTIMRLLKGDAVPTHRTLEKLSSKLGVDINTLTAMVFPGNVYKHSANALRLAQEIESLPSPYLEVVRAFVRTVALQASREEFDEAKGRNG